MMHRNGLSESKTPCQNSKRPEGFLRRHPQQSCSLDKALKNYYQADEKE
jgi:hypothetical protein